MTPVLTSTSSPILLTPSSTPTATATRSTSSLTINLVVEPRSIQNFLFAGDVGEFRLDDAGFDDGDEHGNGRTFTLEPGTYTITERIPNTWYLIDLSCTPAQHVVADQAAHKMVVTMVAGETVGCTFVHQRNAIVRTRTFLDADRNGERGLSETWLSRWPMTLYSQKGSAIQTLDTNNLGKANFNLLLPGTYQVCETIEAGWINSQPVQLDSKLNKPCYTATLAPGQIATAMFGNYAANEQSDSTQSANRANSGGIEITTLPDVTDDEAGYGEEILTDYDAVTVEVFYNVFLPAVSR